MTQDSTASYGVPMGFPDDGSGAIMIDPWLAPFKGALVQRYSNVQSWIKKINDWEGGIDKFTRGYEKFGLNVDKDNNITYREWAPRAKQAWLFGEFNQWHRLSHPMTRDKYGVFEIVIPAKDGQPAIPHNSKLKICMITENDQRIDRIPAWIKYATQDLNGKPVYDARFWNPPPGEKYVFKNQRPKRPKSVRIYEAHIGISSPALKIASYKEFTKDVLPRIAYCGYNVVQLMAIMEHAYYASFGYQVNSVFAASSRFGTPEDLKELIDTAHGLGLSVILDVVHSHASKNVLDGLNRFDGSDDCYFHAGPRGSHQLWDSRLYNYGRFEVMRFLLSNLRFWMEEYQFDGFRFDGVTSMLYINHGVNTVFSGSYDEYFGRGVDAGGVAYLMMANYMLHTLYSESITIAEEVSGMATLCLPVPLGGVGFDYRLAMAVPDMWIKILKEQKDEDWDIGSIRWTLVNRRTDEKTIAYCESHDQALVGDQTIMMHLVRNQIYNSMRTDKPATPVIDRGMALHKMIRLITHSLGGEGYMNFEGNEFGHPEWLDFPREGNNSSFWYARRQFNLIYDSHLRFRMLYEFDAKMNRAEEKYGWLHAPPANIILENYEDYVIVFERANLIWIFNFHPSKSFTDYRVGIEEPGVYVIALNTDATDSGGYDRVDPGTRFFTTPFRWNNRRNFTQVYIPSRSALVLVREDAAKP